MMWGGGGGGVFPPVLKQTVLPQVLVKKKKQKGVRSQRAGSMYLKEPLVCVAGSPLYRCVPGWTPLGCFYLFCFLTILDVQ